MNSQKILLIIYISIFFYVSVYAVTNPVNKIENTGAIELQAVQTPANTFVAAIMAFGADDKINYVSKIYRSSDNGISWDSVYCIQNDKTYFREPDPVIAIDNAGNIYVLCMRIPISSSSTAHLSIYKSTDDGLTWKLSGIPYSGDDMADFPNIIASGNGNVFLSYSDYTFYPSMKSKINFLKSSDGGATWSKPSVFTAPISDMVVGSDINWGYNNKIYITYGDYLIKAVYYVSSKDYGATWEPRGQINNIDTFTVNKIISSPKYSHLGIITHHPHSPNAEIYYSYSLDDGYSWKTNIIDTHSGLAEGAMDSRGNIHIIYNHLQNNTFNLMYVFSKDKGITFSTPDILYSKTNNVIDNYGEYQSVILANDGLFHLTFLDWGDYTKVKQIIFAPDLTSIEEVSSISDAPSVFPNPAIDYINIKSNLAINDNFYELFDITGKMILKGALTNEITKINIANISPGTYILSINCGNRVFIQKIVKN